MAGMFSSGSAWIIKDSEKLKYEGIFESLKPVAGKLPGDKV